MTRVVTPVRTLRPGPLTRAVLTVDRGVIMRRVIPVPVMVALDERHLFADAHLCYGADDDASADVRGFRARALVYAALTLSPDKQRYLYDHVMSLDAIVRDAALVPATRFERDRAELFDAIQGGNRAELLGVRPSALREASRFEPLMDHA
jgi:hypothetical protein